MAFEHYDKCSILLPMDGANNGTTFTDWSPNPKTITANGNAKTVTAQSKFYGSSLSLPNSGSNYLSVPFTSDLNFGTGQFTIACWIYISGSPASGGELFQIIQAGRRSTVAGNGGYSLRLSSLTQIVLESVRIGSTVVSSANIPTISNNQWVHVACTRDATGVQFYIDGTKYAGSDAFMSESITNPSSLSIIVGASGATAPFNWYSNGYMQDLIIVKGAALWAVNFTPPTRLVGEISGTVKDKDDSPASRIVTAVPRCNPSRLFQTTSSAVDGSYSLRVPATEVSRIALADETTLYNDIVDRIIPE